MKLLQFLVPAASLGVMLTAPGAAAADIRPETLPAGQHLYVIEREIPNAGKLTPAELKDIAQKSCKVIDGIGPQIRWVHSYVTAQKIYCVYVAPDEETIREHARRGGFPANKISRVGAIFGPETAK
ncbi:MAG TPA: DUF4242 domain-containing protein [Opitutaceae bacterium]|nr:DUF4242 domain-containing protein [Opitutaceae bacterium]